MALIIPANNFENNMTQGEKYTLEQKIKKTLNSDNIGDTFVYVQQTVNGLRPDFILINQYFGICIIEVKDWSDSYIQEMNHKFVRTSDDSVLKNPILQIKQYRNILQSNLINVSDFMNNIGECNIPIKLMIFFPYMSDLKIDEYQRFLQSEHVEIYNRTKLRTLKDTDFFSNAHRVMNAKELDVLRGTIFPENILPNNKPISNDEILTIKDIKALDRDQEEFAKKIPNGHYMVSGLPGSGKTVMLLTRAIHLAKVDKNQKIIILTYTKRLASKLADQLKTKISEMQLPSDFCTNIEIKHFHNLCFNLTGKLLQPSNMSDNDFYSHYIPKKAIEVALKLPDEDLYDHVLIDEYQDFHPEWFQLSKLMCKKTDGIENLFLAGDRLQRIYKCDWNSYKEIGINIVGRSKLLKIPYRTNQGNIDIALKFLSNNESLKRDINNFYELENLDNIAPIDSIEHIPYEHTTIIDKINEFIESGYSHEEILVLFPNNNNIKEFVDALKITNNININSCNLTTYHSSKGLEAKICFLCLFDKFKENTTSRRIIYVGMTRASEKLILSPNDSSTFTEELKEILKFN
ncbi:TPA: UvrD-helicase domain-containing protein [Photobacterium damselae]